MKLLCVYDYRGMAFPTPKLGGVYTYKGRFDCPCGVSWYDLAEVPSPFADERCWCAKCGREVDRDCSWLTKNFVPFKPEQLGITEQEVRNLYQPGPKAPIKEKA